MGRDVSRYQVDGVRVPSVTEVLKLCGMIDFSGIDPETLERARDRGEEVHHWIELLEAGERATPEDPEVAGRVEAYRAFRDAEAFAVYGSEVPLVNRTYRFAGTPDLIGRMSKRNEVAVIDVKPPGRVERWWHLQTAGYALALEGGAAREDLAALFARTEYLSAHQTRRYVLRLRGDGSFKLDASPDPRRDVHDFYAALRVAHWHLEANGGVIPT